VCEACRIVIRAELELLERDAELTVLRSCLEDVRGGAGRLVVIEGEAGIGKTALMQAACADARESEMLVLAARGTQLECDFPFSLVRQLFERLVRAAAPAEQEELLAGAARLAGPLVGVEADSERLDGSAGPMLDPSFPTLNALFWLVSNLSETGPTVLAVDDAHWADPASLRFLEFLLPRLEDVRVLLVVAARPGEPDGAPTRLAGLISDDVARVIRPRALSPTAVADLVRATLAPGATEAFCAACEEVTRGNPFLLRELLTELLAVESDGAAADAGLVREMAPSSIGRAVLLRLARLPAPARRVAEAVAVLGDGCELRHAAALAECDPAGGEAAVDALADAAIFEPGSRPSFAHPLVRNAIHADLPPSERAALHRRAARLLADDGAPPERVALHLLATAPRGDAAVVETLAAAAQRALDRAAPEAAIRYLERALAEPASPGARPEILRMHMTAGMRIGDVALADQIGDDPIAELSANPETLLATAGPVTLWLLASGRASEVPALLDRAIALASNRGELELALQMEASLAALSVLTPAEARARLARHADSVVPGTEGERVWLAVQGWWGTLLGDSAAHTGEMARRALSNGLIFAEQPTSPAPAQAILVLLRTEQLDLAADRIDALAVEARARGFALGLTQASFLRANVALLRGDVTRADAEARSAVEAARGGGWLAAVPIFLAVYLDALIERGEPAAADHELAQAGFTGAMPENYWWGPLLVSRGRLRLAQRRFGEAVSDLLELERQNERAGIWNPSQHLGSHLALALAAQGESEAARRSADAELERARAWGAPGEVGATLRVRGLLATGRERLELLEEAVSVLAPSPVRLEYLRALTEYGAALRRAGRRADARVPLREAVELARRGGALAIGKRAHEELAATGEKLRPLVAAGVESLTPSERRVTELAGQGLSNRDIAQALFLTVKTVEGHLSHAYRKLDIGSRKELAGVLHG
jgi:DNA-binding CsgD family transcriptional regulator